MTEVGLSVLFRERFGLVEGRSIGLITNQTGIDPQFRRNLTLFAEHPKVELAAIFSPEHGISGSAQAGTQIASAIGKGRQIPIYSLYGETRQPTPKMLAGIDVLMYDVQDIGARFYTYISTLLRSMKAAAANNVDFIVLDRPNPIRGDRVEGNVLQPAFQSFVGEMAIPVRHAMTVGELAQFCRAELDSAPSPRLHVVPMDGWQRRMWYDQTGLPWVPPSPNMPTVETATLYPGTCLIEGTNLSEGRGTTKPFEWIGAPWIDPARWADMLNSLELPGTHFRAIHFTPTFSKYANHECHGVQVHVTNRNHFKPIDVALHLITTAQRNYLDHFEFLKTRGRYFFDLLAGTDELRLKLTKHDSPTEIVQSWEAEVTKFTEQGRPYLLYD
ncbi:DUF1343 domain-containing protein [Candidatus Poribacteria bacterium]|nr:MAG: DUF1343 domain-containing protein [Candidatus Poribacteria bacterium]